MDIRKWTARLAIAFAATGCARGPEEKTPESVPALPGEEGGSHLPEASSPPIGPEIPAYKKNFLMTQGGGSESWSAFYNALAIGDDFSATEVFVYSQIFAAEGGMARAPGGSAVGGIMNDTLEKLRADDRPQVQDLRRACAGMRDTSAITPRLLADLYAYDFDNRFRALENGRGALDDIGNIHAAAMLADTLFRFGDRGAAELVSGVINEMKKGDKGFKKIESPDLVGPRIMRAYTELARNPATLPALLDGIARARIRKTDEKAREIANPRSRENYRKGEAARSRHFTFAEKVARRDAGLRGPG